jgi:hypothetical protein
MTPRPRSLLGVIRRVWSKVKIYVQMPRNSIQISDILHTSIGNLCPRLLNLVLGKTLFPK